MAERDEQGTVELLESLDFEPTCQLRSLPAVLVFGVLVVTGKVPVTCGGAAVAFMACNRCRYGWLVCAEHKAEAHSQDAAICGRCRARDRGADLFSFTPLGGA